MGDASIIFQEYLEWRKTALKLLAEYDSIENILEHLDDFQEKLGERLRKIKDMAILKQKISHHFLLCGNGIRCRYPKGKKTRL